ncbi:MAG: ATP-binding cassette domain-containing protein [Agathobacter sp.]
MLQMDHLVKTYGSFRLECTMELKPGRVTGLIGRNGAGKSTAFKALLGLIRPDSGSVTVMGKPVGQMTGDDKKKLGVVLADSGFSTYLSVKDVAVVLHSMYDTFDKNRFLETCRNSELPLDKKIKEFSTGMKAKLKVLIAMSHGASLLILDEPTVGLDVVARDEILDLLRQYMAEDEKRSILISSHISSDLESLCDDLYLIDHGQILVHEETDVLLSDYALLKISGEQYEKLDKKYLLRRKEESYGYACLTNQRQYYEENYPQIAVEKGSIDELIIMMAGGEKL